MEKPLIRAANDISLIRPSTSSTSGSVRPTLVCFSHLRWGFVLQRPQHLMIRMARDFEVFIWEEPVAADAGEASTLTVRPAPQTGVTVITPRLASDIDSEGREIALRRLLKSSLDTRGGPIIRWYYTPMMLPFSRDMKVVCTVYDCMDELSNFRFAPPDLPMLERELFGLADVVFTGGHGLYEAKRGAHKNIHPFPSSVDRGHFARARQSLPEQPDQRDLPRPRLGYFGVVDERVDLDLLAKVADAHPEWSLVIVGPVVKIDPAKLPSRHNIAYLGIKTYDELPAYLSGWDVALMPFALNASTRFISPTKTPEYLAGGRPVVSTAIVDVRRQYGRLDGVIIADTAADFVSGCEKALALGAGWLDECDKALADLSWERTQGEMLRLVEEATAHRAARSVVLPRVSLGPSGRSPAFDFMIVGAGFAGAVLAERIAAGLGRRVLVIDRRPHIGGNAHDRHDRAGLLIHQYGPHIFHTNSKDIFAYLSRFTRWRPYEHRVLTSVGDQFLPMPINRTTLNALYGAALETDQETEAFLAARAEPTADVRTAEDVVVSKVGRDLYEKFFRGYTRKQWGMDPSQLDAAAPARVPARANADDRYFLDTFQAMPAAGYTAMFEKMLDHPNIQVETGTSFQDVRGEYQYEHLIYTGPIDEYFGYRFGTLPYRSLRFRHETIETERFQPVATINYPAEWIPYTRVTEYKHLTGQKHAHTSITYEYPAAEGDPYYPVPQSENYALFKMYEALALKTPDVSFVGRLATYRYYNMDQVVGQALATYRRLARQRAPHEARSLEPASYAV